MLKKRLISVLLVVLMLTSAISASAVFIADVPQNNWAYGYVSYMVESTIMPLDEDCFYPDSLTTRGEFVYYLWRAADAPDASVSRPTFTDVGAYTQFYYAVEWAVKNGITTGTSATTFSPDLALTREQAFTFLWRAMPFFGFDTSGNWGSNLGGFKDNSDVDTWARPAMNGLCKLGIVTGTDTGYLMPLRDVLNIETATILYKTLDLMGVISTGGIYFTLYNEGPYNIYSFNVLPAYTDGEGMDLLPDLLKAGESYYVDLSGDFVYADSDSWTIKLEDVHGYTNGDYPIFNPHDTNYIDIFWDEYAEEYYCVAY